VHKPKHSSRNSSKRIPIFVRLSLIAVGVLLILSGMQLLNRGVFVYQNTWFRGTNYSPGTIATGVVIGLLAFLPPPTWIDRWINRRRDKH
jgi:hypothetical protein